MLRSGRVGRARGAGMTAPMAARARVPCGAREARSLEARAGGRGRHLNWDVGTWLEKPHARYAAELPRTRGSHAVCTEP